MRVSHNLLSCTASAALLGLILLLVPAALRAADQLITPAQVHEWREEGRPHFLIDVRSETLFEIGHIPSAMNIHADLLPYFMLPEGVPVVLYDNDLSGLTSRTAAEALAEAQPRLSIYRLRGGLRTWEAQGLPSTRSAGEFDPELENTITSDDLREAIIRGIPVQILDLRDGESFVKSTIPGAINVPVLLAVDKLAQLKSDRLDLMLALPKESHAKIAEASDINTQQAAAEELARTILDGVKKHAENLKSEGKPAPGGPIVLVDHGGAFSAKALPTLKRFGREETPEVLILERGFVGWQATGGLLQPGHRESIFHGSSSFDSTGRQID